MSKYYIDTYNDTSKPPNGVLARASCSYKRHNDKYDYSTSFFDSVSRAKSFAEKIAGINKDYQPEIILSLEAAILLEKEIEKIQT